jgi:hypothetical protein
VQVKERSSKWLLDDPTQLMPIHVVKFEVVEDVPLEDADSFVEEYYSIELAERPAGLPSDVRLRDVSYKHLKDVPTAAYLGAVDPTGDSLQPLGTFLAHGGELDSEPWGVNQTLASSLISNLQRLEALGLLVQT